MVCRQRQGAPGPFTDRIQAHAHFISTLLYWLLCKFVQFSVSCHLCLLPPLSSLVLFHRPSFDPGLLVFVFQDRDGKAPRRAVCAFSDFGCKNRFRSDGPPQGLFRSFTQIDYDFLSGEEFASDPDVLPEPGARTLICSACARRLARVKAREVSGDFSFFLASNIIHFVFLSEQAGYSTLFPSYVHRAGRGEEKSAAPAAAASSSSSASVPPAADVRLFLLLFSLTHCCLCVGTRRHWASEREKGECPLC